MTLIVCVYRYFIKGECMYIITIIIVQHASNYAYNCLRKLVGNTKISIQNYFIKCLFVNYHSARRAYPLTLACLQYALYLSRHMIHCKNEA